VGEVQMLRNLLLLFNEIYNYPLSDEELISLGEQIGSDVPLF